MRASLVSEALRRRYKWASLIRLALAAGENVGLKEADLKSAIRTADGLRHAARAIGADRAVRIVRRGVEVYVLIRARAGELCPWAPKGTCDRPGGGRPDLTGPTCPQCGRSYLRCDYCGWGLRY